jgi:hypothetical protein
MSRVDRMSVAQAAVTARRLVVKLRQDTHVRRLAHAVDEASSLEDGALTPDAETSQLEKVVAEGRSA